MIEISKIKKLTLEITSYCNLQCPQCARFTADGFLTNSLSTSHLSLDVFRQGVELEKCTQLQEVEFQGEHGDCMMHPQLLDYLHLLTDVRKVILVTNGSIGNPKYFRQLADFKNLKIVFSIDGLEDTNHIYRINSRFDKIIKNATSFIDAGGEAEWKYLIFKHNQHQVEKAKELSKKIGFRKFFSKPTARNFFGTGTWPVMIEGVYSHNIEIADAINPAKKSNIIASTKEKYIEPKCSWIEKDNALYVNHRGHVLPCCMTSGTTWGQSMSDRLFRKIIGNIDNIDLHHNSLEKILQGEFYTQRLKNSWESQKTAHHLCVSNCT